METLSALIPILLPVYVVVAVGFAWERFRQPFEAPLLDSIGHVIALPCLVLWTMAHATIPADAILTMLAAAILAYAGFAGVGWAVVRAGGRDIAAGLPAVALPMTGAIGLPLALFGFGQDGLALALVFTTVGIAVRAAFFEGENPGRFDARRLARVPSLYALALALALSEAGLALPAWAANTTRLLGAALLPLMLLTAGVMLSRLRPADLKGGMMLALARLGLGLGLGVGLAAGFGFTGAARAIVIIQCAMPAALMPQLLLAGKGEAPELLASAYAVSVALSLLTLPALYLFAAG